MRLTIAVKKEFGVVDFGCMCGNPTLLAGSVGDLSREWLRKNIVLS